MRCISESSSAAPSSKLIVIRCQHSVNPVGWSAWVRECECTCVDIRRQIIPLNDSNWQLQYNVVSLMMFTEI